MILRPAIAIFLMVFIVSNRHGGCVKHFVDMRLVYEPRVAPSVHVEPVFIGNDFNVYLVILVLIFVEIPNYGSSRISYPSSCRGFNAIIIS